jgi:hypothetical protein
MILEYGVFALDPGLSSAWAVGIVRDEGTMADRLAARQESRSSTLREPDWVVQARTISTDWMDFRLDCHRRGIPAFFVCEDFILTRFKSSDRSGLYPVWVAAAVVGYRNGIADAYESGGFGPAAPIEVVWQQPSQAKTHATDERLRRWGMWIKGREHERDAWRHFAYFVANPASQKYRQARARTLPRSRMCT